MDAIKFDVATVARADLNRALAIVMAVVEKGNTVPILSYVSLTATANGLKIVGTNIDEFISTTIPAQCTKGMRVCVDAVTLRKIASRCEAENISFIIHKDAQPGDSLEIVAGAFSAKLSTLPHDDFPEPLAVKWKWKFTMNGDALRGMFGRCLHAVSTEEIHYYFNGVYFHEDDEKLKACATDGHRMVVIDAALPKGAKGMPGQIIRRETVRHMLKILRRNSLPVAVKIGEGSVCFAVDGFEVITKAIDGTYPEYQRIIPQGNLESATFAPKHVIAAINRLRSLRTDRDAAIRMSIGSGSIDIEANSHDSLDTANEKIPAKVCAPVGAIGFNARYLREMLKQFDGNAVAYIADAKYAVLFRDIADSHAIYVLMPMML